MGKILKEHLGLAAEFAVASELCRRNFYAQLTFGNRKRTDILIAISDDRFIRIEVKAKQGRDWPNCKGVGPGESFLVFVDFAGKQLNERPDYYVLTPAEWLKLIKNRIREFSGSRGHIEISNEYVPIWHDQVKNGRPYRGMGAASI